MLFASSRGGGLGVLVVLGAVLYFTGAGSWIVQRFSTIDSGCYTLVGKIDPGLAQPVCSVVAKGKAMVQSVGPFVRQQFEHLKMTVGISDGFTALESYGAAFLKQGASLRSSPQTLARLTKTGPTSVSAHSAVQQFQAAIDSFAIGQSYLYGNGSTQNAISWLKFGAVQPQGYGVMSQLSLGQLYATGRHGLPQDKDMAYMYLQQANSSLTTLMQANDPQSQQLLKSLPGDPQEIQKQIFRAIKEMQLSAQR